MVGAMTNDLPAAAAGQWRLGDLPVNRLGYGAMQLAGPNVFGPPADESAAIDVLRRAVDLGVNHIDTSDYYGPFVVNELIRKALHPYPSDLVIVTKVGGRRDPTGGWLPALRPDEIRQAVHDNLTRLALDHLDVVNLRRFQEPAISEHVAVLASLRDQGLIRHIGISNVSSTHLAQALEITPVACVQNLYNITTRTDDPLVDLCLEQGIAYVPFFPLGGFQPLQASVLDHVAARHAATPRQVALAWLLHRSPTILLIPGTSSPVHLAENLASARLALTPTDLTELDNLP
jgi:pyridoxine 4-dehydrogenase